MNTVDAADVYGGPTEGLRKMLDMDLLRKSIYDRTAQAMEVYQKVYNCNPSWVRVSFDLVHRAGPAAYGPHLSTICGLEFRLDVGSSDCVEVGSSTKA